MFKKGKKKKSKSPNGASPPSSNASSSGGGGASKSVLSDLPRQRLSTRDRNNLIRPVAGVARPSRLIASRALARDAIAESGRRGTVAGSSDQQFISGYTSLRRSVPPPRQLDDARRIVRDATGHNSPPHRTRVGGTLRRSSAGAALQLDEEKEKAAPASPPPSISSPRGVDAMMGTTSVPRSVSGGKAHGPSKMMAEKRVGNNGPGARGVGQAGAMRGQRGVNRGQRGVTRGQRGVTRGQRGVTRGQRGVTRGQRGAMRGHRGVNRGQRGAMRGQRGAMRGQRGALRGQRGALRGQRGQRGASRGRGRGYRGPRRARGGRRGTRGHAPPLRGGGGPHSASTTGDAPPGVRDGNAPHRLSDAGLLDTLHAAILQGAISSIARHIRSRGDVMERSPATQQNALHVACSCVPMNLGVFAHILSHASATSSPSSSPPPAIAPGIIDAQDVGGWTPLHVLCKHSCDADAIDHLIARGVNVCSTTKEGNTPLHYYVRHSPIATHHWTIEEAQALMQARTIEEYLSSSSVLVVASEEGHHRRPTPVPGVVGDGSAGGTSSAAARAVARYAATFHRCCHAGAQVDAMAHNGETPMHCAVQMGNFIAVKLLTMWGASVTLSKTGRDTPLHYATFMRSVPMVHVLLVLGADPLAPGRRGTSMEVARQAGGEASDALESLLGAPPEPIATPEPMRPEPSMALASSLPPLPVLPHHHDDDDDDASRSDGGGVGGGSSSSTTTTTTSSSSSSSAAVHQDGGGSSGGGSNKQTRSRGRLFRKKHRIKAHANEEEDQNNAGGGADGDGDGSVAMGDDGGGGDGGGGDGRPRSRIAKARVFATATEALGCARSVQELKRFKKQHPDQKFLGKAVVHQPSGRHALHVVCGHAHASTDVVRYLLQRKACVHAQDAAGMTPLHHAVKAASPGVVALLLEAGAACTTHSHRGALPIDCLGSRPMDGAEAIASAGEVVDLLIRVGGVDLNERNLRVGGAPPLFSVLHRAECMRVLLERGADPGTRAASYAGRKDQSPLEAAIRHVGTAPQVAVLLDFGADPIKTHAMELAQEVEDEVEREHILAMLAQRAQELESARETTPREAMLKLLKLTREERRQEEKRAKRLEEELLALEEELKMERHRAEMLKCK